MPKTLGEILRQASGKGKPITEHIRNMIDQAEEEGRSPYSCACIDTINRVINTSPNTLAGIVSTFNAPLLVFQNLRVDMATSTNDFNLRDVRSKRIYIYIGITSDKLKAASVIVNIFFDQLLNLNTRELPQQDPSFKYQCLLILDEFTGLGKINMIQQFVAYQAGYNMRILTIIQNKSQLEEKYGKEGAVTLISNHALMVMYAPSPSLQQDANEYSEMLGYETVKSRNKSITSNMGSLVRSSSSESESDQKRALMLPQELKEIGPWKEIITLDNCKPIFCDKIKYYTDPNFTSRTVFNPPAIPVHNVYEFMQHLSSGAGDSIEASFNQGAGTSNEVSQETAQSSLTADATLLANTNITQTNLKSDPELDLFNSPADSALVQNLQEDAEMASILQAYNELTEDPKTPEDSELSDIMNAANMFREEDQGNASNYGEQQAKELGSFNELNAPESTGQANLTATSGEQVVMAELHKVNELNELENTAQANLTVDSGEQLATAELHPVNEIEDKAQTTKRLLRQ